jgi:methionyl-tRNA formyltransferase
MIKDPHFEVVGVVTQPDRPAGRKMQLTPSPVKTLVEPLGIPVLTPENVNEQSVLDQIKTFKAEVAVVVAFGQIMKQPLLDMFPAKIVNVHASLLPRWRGAAPIQRAIMAGDKETGVCMQVMVRKLDAGPVLGQRKFALTPEMTAFDSYDLCQKLGAELIAVDLMDYLRGNLSALPQDPQLVTFAPKIEKADAEVDWTKSGEEIHNLVRGLYLGPNAFTSRAGKTLKLWKTRVTGSGSASLKPGQVRDVTEKSLIVQCGTGSLELLEVQPESRSRMPIGEYLRGYPMSVGDSFASRGAQP